MSDAARRGAVPRPFDPFMLVMLAGIFVLGAVMVLSYPTNHDVAWLLHVAAEVTGGADLYQDVIEPNPPLIVYGLMPITTLADLLGVARMDLFRVAVLLLVAGTLAGSGRLLWTAQPEEERGGLPLLLLAAVGLVVALPGFDFGQRDHLVVVLLLPLLSLVGHRARGSEVPTPVAVAVGCCAAVGIALKPFALVVWLAQEGYLRIRNGELPLIRAEGVTIVTVGVLYIALVALVEPDFFGFAGAAMDAYRSYYPATPLILLRQPSTILAVAAVAVSRLLVRRGPLSELRRVLEVAAVAFLFNVFLQNKGWPYHWIPVHTVVGLLVVAVILDVWARRSTDAVDAAPWRVPTGALRLSGVLVFVAVGAWSVRESERVQTELARFSFYEPIMRSVFETWGEDGAVMALSVRLAPGMALAVDERSSVRWGSRFNVLWPIPGLYGAASPPGSGGFPYHPEAERPDLEWFLLAGVTEDFLRSRPTLLVVDGVSPQGVDGFDILEYFQRASPAFRDEFRRYQPLMRLGDYMVYRRGVPPGGAPPA